MSLSDAYMTALKEYIEAQYSADPPENATIGIVKIGTLQDNPEAYPAVITIHAHNPVDENSKHIELITDQGSTQGFARHRLWGAYTEFGDDGKGSSYWYNWWVRVEYYMRPLAFDQETASQRNSELITWLKSKIIAAQPHVLSLTLDTDEAALLQIKVAEVNTREHGGKPTSYIYSTMFHIRGLAFGD